MASLGGEYTLTYNTFDLLYNVLVTASLLDRGLQSATVYLAISLLFCLVTDSVMNGPQFGLVVCFPRWYSGLLNTFAHFWTPTIGT